MIRGVDTSIATGRREQEKRKKDVESDANELKRQLGRMNVSLSVVSGDTTPLRDRAPPLRRIFDECRPRTPS